MGPLFIFNLQIKERGQSYTYMLNCYNIIHQHNSLIHTLPHTYLSNQALAAPQQVSPSLLPSQSRLSLFTYHVRMDALQLPIDSLAWLFLAQILLLIVAPTQTLINHIDTHHG